MANFLLSIKFYDEKNAIIKLIKTSDGKLIKTYWFVGNRFLNGVNHQFSHNEKIFFIQKDSSKFGTLIIQRMEP